MRPVVEKKGFELRHAIYILIILICIIAIVIAVYNIQYFKDEKIGVILGISKEENDEEIKALQRDFLNIFTNDINIIEQYNERINKIKDNQEVVVIASDIQEQTKNYTLNLKIPYININTNLAKRINNEIKLTFKDKSQSVISSSKDDDNIIYNVKYKAFEENNILSLVILSELKEGESSQRIIIQTYNYDLKEDKLITIEDMLKIKNIDVKTANNYIKSEINHSQEENIKLSDLGYNVKVRDAESNFYKIENAEQFFIGENGYLYIVYPYGNTEFTSEIDVIIFK